MPAGCGGGAAAEGGGGGGGGGKNGDPDHPPAERAVSSLFNPSQTCSTIDTRRLINLHFGVLSLCFLPIEFPFNADTRAGLCAAACPPICFHIDCWLLSQMTTAPTLVLLSHLGLSIVADFGIMARVQIWRHSLVFSKPSLPELIVLQN